MFSASWLVNWPMGYWLVSRMNPNRFIGWMFRYYLFWISFGVAAFSYSIPRAFLLVTMGWFLHISIYEFGYWQNDLLAIKGEKGTERLRPGFSSIDPILYIFTRITLYGLCMLFFYNYNCSEYMGFLSGCTFSIFLIHNLVDLPCRPYSFALLKFLSWFTPIAPLFILCRRDVGYWGIIFFFIVLAFDIGPKCFMYAVRKLHGIDLDKVENSLPILSLQFVIPMLIVGVVFSSSIMMVLLTIYWGGVNLGILLLRNFKKKRRSATRISNYLDH